MSNADNVAGLNHFEILAAGETAKGQTVQIYSNGRQQYQVDIAIEAVDKNGHVINLSEDDMKTVILMDYNSEREFENTFGRSYTWAGYELAGPRSQETSPTPDAASTLRFYEHAMPSTHGTVKIAAKITLGGVVYKTNGTEAEPGGKVVNGKSNSYFHLTALTPQRFYANSFTSQNTGGIGYGYDDPGNAPGYQRYFDLWKIKFIDSRYKIYGSSTSDTKPINWFSQWAEGPKQRCHWLLPVRRDKGKTVYLGRQPSGSHGWDCFMLPYREVGVAYAVIEESTHMTEHAYAATGITFIDNYGNSHDVVLRPNNNGTTFQIDDN